MKTVFNIPINSNSNSLSDLLMEFGDNSINLLWTNHQTKEIEGYQVFVFEENENYGNVMDEFEKATSSSINKVGKVKIYFNFKESILVPEKLYKKDLDKELISLMYGDDFNSIIKTETIEGKSIQHIYRLPKALQSFVEKHHKSILTMHSTSMQIKNEVNGSAIKCMFYHESFKVIVYKEGELQLVQQFNYANPSDATYHLLNVCQQFHLNPKEVSLMISGMIANDSKLFQSLYNCFLHIDLVSPQTEFQLSESLSSLSLPLHFFSHLTELLSCEL